MNEREKLIDKLIKLGVFITRDHAYCVADFIIAERKRITRPIFAYKLGRIEVSETWPENDAEIAMEEVLKRARDNSNV